MNGKRFSENKARKNGFYLALAVCLVAVGIAAWSTYDAVQSYTAANNRDSASLNQLQNDQVRSGQEQGPVDDDPQKPVSTPAPSRQTDNAFTAVRPEASSAAPEITPSPKPEPEPEPESQQEPEEELVPATAPLYERSSEMIFPLSTQKVLKAYSSGAPVYSQTMKDWRIHAGTDLEAAAGEEVRACANGQVKQTYTDSMLGNVMVVEHGDYEFSYCGLGEEFLMQAGDLVTKGQVIGTVTAVPSEAADAPHLHVEVRRDGVCLDPQSVLEGKYQ